MTVENKNEVATGDDVQAMGRLRDTLDEVRAELGKVVIGQSEVVDELLMCLVARGHSPG